MLLHRNVFYIYFRIACGALPVNPPSSTIMLWTRHFHNHAQRCDCTQPAYMVRVG